MKNSGKLLIILVSILGGAVSTCPLRSDVKDSSKIEVETIPIEILSKNGKKPIIVAVIDTGFDFNSNWDSIVKNNPKIKKPKMCKYGHKDFTGIGLQDNHGHGTHIAGIIAQYALDQDYCIVVIKFYDPLLKNANFVELTDLAFKRAVDLKVDIINYSGGGTERDREECLILKKALDRGIKVVAAAGNEGSNINEKPYYPAMCEDRIIAVANIEKDGKYAKTSNFSDPTDVNSRKLAVQEGVNVMSLSPGNRVAIMTGTSQAAAIETGKIVKNWKKQ